MPNSQRYARGAAKMKELFGAEPRPGTMHPDFLEITVEHLFGDIWTRPGLELRERSMITVAALTVLARERELKVHLRGALNAGITRDKIQEIMIHLAHYGGWPVAVNGLRIAKEVFDEADAKK
ncbi:MAG TPA: carboxymuconolactone decarboxylase family protein [Candidatus Binataceae bacterium]